MEQREKQEQEEQKPQVYKNSQEQNEEIGEKRTSALGYVFLMIMVIFVIGVGETIFSDLTNLVERPTAPSSCVLHTSQSLESLNSLHCPGYKGFNLVDKKFNLDTKYTLIEPQLKTILVLNNEIKTNEKALLRVEKNIQQNNKDYDLSLQEKIADEDAIMNKSDIRGNITGLKSQKNILENKNLGLIKEKKLLISDVSAQTVSLKQDYDSAQEYYQNKKAWYKFKTFLLTLLFVLPFFCLSVFYYFKLKRKNSPYTIILTAVTTAFSFLLIQVVLVFLYDILPKEWLARIFRIFIDVPFLRYVIYYGSVLLVIGVFGGIVFYIQKRVFNKTKVAIRRLKDKKCPNCSFPVNPQNNFCPDCGLKLKDRCDKCGNMKIVYLPFCPHCGKE